MSGITTFFLLFQDSAKHLKDLNVAVRSQRGGATSEQRQRRLQFDSLQDDFTKALNSFQQVQTQAAQKEKDVIKKARNNSGEVFTKSFKKSLFAVEARPETGQLYF